MGVDVGELDEEAAAKYEELMKRLKFLMRRYKDVEGRPEAPPATIDKYVVEAYFDSALGGDFWSTKKAASP